MKTMILAVLATTIALPAAAQSSGGTVLTNPEFAGGFKNRGQCEAALAGVRNSQRANPDTRGEGYQDLDGSDFNKASRTTTRCEMVDGKYQVVFYSGGFPG